MAMASCGGCSEGGRARYCSQLTRRRLHGTLKHLASPPLQPRVDSRLAPHVHSSWPEPAAGNSVTTTGADSGTGSGADAQGGDEASAVVGQRKVVRRAEANGSNDGQAECDGEEQIATVGAWTAQACWGVALCRPGARAAAAEPSTSESVEQSKAADHLSLVDLFEDRGAAVSAASAVCALGWKMVRPWQSQQLEMRIATGTNGSRSPDHRPVPAPVPEPAMTRA